nr:cytidylate kinase-like family protein [Anaerosporobacter sp.]
MGRGADHILKELPNCLNIFIHADLVFRIKRVMEYDHISTEEAKKHIMSQDKTRTFHYQYYTENKWGNSKNYHLCLDSGMLGIEKCVSIIEDIYLN